MTRYSHLSGTAGTVTVPSGCVVRSIRAHATSAGTLIITPVGASALPTITLPASSQWFELEFPEALEELVDGTTLVFASTDAYLVTTRLVGGV
jgi:hypothetical protein